MDFGKLFGAFVLGAVVAAGAGLTVYYGKRWLDKRSSMGAAA